MFSKWTPKNLTIAVSIPLFFFMDVRFYFLSAIIKASEKKQIHPPVDGCFTLLHHCLHEAL